MLFKRIESEGLAHYSYIVGDLGEAVVIDPRRDCDVYIREALADEMKIKYVLETHRNEDYVIGSVQLASLTGAEIWHADAQLQYEYGLPVKDCQTWKIGRLVIRAIETPGHTPGSFSYLLSDLNGYPWIVFTGDALFAGDVGRVDLLGMDRAFEMACFLEESIYDRLLPLGDGVIVCPAHGPGSACGTAISDRPLTTIGIERIHNAKLVGGREGFVSRVAVELERPPYFRRMESLNLVGPISPRDIKSKTPLNPDEFEQLTENSLILDTRSELSFASAHINGSQFIWMDGLASYAGWMLSYDQPILLVCDDDDLELALKILYREGFDDVNGHLTGGMLSWHMAGKTSKSTKVVTVQELCRRIDDGLPLYLLDIRPEEEQNRSGKIPRAVTLPIAQIQERIDEIPRDREVYIFCGSGMRSMVAASFLEQMGFHDVIVVLGGLAGWKSVICPIAK